MSLEALYVQQWAFGVTCWEVFTCGLVPYHGISAMAVLNVLKNGERLDKPVLMECKSHMSLLLMPLVISHSTSILSDLMVLCYCIHVVIEASCYIHM